MDLTLPESHRALQTSLRDFCEEHVKPHARQWDHEEKFPAGVVKALGELGALGILVSEEYGGAGMDSLAVAVAVEEIARYDGSLALTVASHNGLGTSHIRVFGNDAQRTALPAEAGHRRVARGLGAHRAGQRLGRRGDEDHRRPPGRPLGPQRQQDVHHPGHRRARCSSCWPSPSPAAPEGHHRLHRGEGTCPGSASGPSTASSGCAAPTPGELILENVEIPDSQRLGELGMGFVNTLQILDKGRITIGALSIGLARGAVEESAQYARERRAFGKPIADFEAIRWMLADMQTELQAARLLVHRAAVLADKGRPVRPRGEHGQAVRQRGRHPGLQQGGSDPRWLRLHPGVPRGALPARREALRDWRGDQRGAAHGRSPASCSRPNDPRCRWKRNGWRSSGSRCRRARPARRSCSRYSARW